MRRRCGRGAAPTRPHAQIERVRVLLRALPLFKGVRDEVVSAVAAAGDRCQVNKGQTVVLGDQPMPGALFVVSGRLAVDAKPDSDEDSRESDPALRTRGLPACVSIKDMSDHDIQVLLQNSSLDRVRQPPWMDDCPPQTARPWEPSRKRRPITRATGKRPSLRRLRSCTPQRSTVDTDATEAPEQPVQLRPRDVVGASHLLHSGPTPGPLPLAPASVTATEQSTVMLVSKVRDAVRRREAPASLTHSPAESAVCDHGVLGQAGDAQELRALLRVATICTDCNTLRSAARRPRASLPPQPQQSLHAPRS